MKHSTDQMALAFVVAELDKMTPVAEALDSPAETAPAPTTVLAPRRKKNASQPIVRTLSWCHNDAPRELVRLLTKCGYCAWSSREIFSDWLDAVDISLDRIPSFFNQLTHGEPLVDPPEIATRWKRIADRYQPDTLEIFAEAFAILVAATQTDEGEYSYADLLGQVFMEFGSKGDAQWHGQFFTPWNVAKMMALMTDLDLEAELVRRLDTALEFSSTYALGKLMGVEMTIERKLLCYDADPKAREHYAVYKMCDPAVGSGVLILAHASCCPRWAIDRQMVTFFGNDISEACVKMARLNIRLYGLNGIHYSFAKATESAIVVKGESNDQ